MVVVVDATATNSVLLNVFEAAVRRPSIHFVQPSPAGLPQRVGPAVAIEPPDWAPIFRLVCRFTIRGRIGHEQQFMKEAAVEIEGIVQTVLPGTMFRVELENKHLVLATISGKMRKRWVRLTVGDRVKMEMSPYDLDKARIVWRVK